MYRGASGLSRCPTAAATCRHHAEAPATASSSSSFSPPPPSSPPLPLPPPPLPSLSHFEPERSTYATSSTRTTSTQNDSNGKTKRNATHDHRMCAKKRFSHLRCPQLPARDRRSTWGRQTTAVIVPKKSSSHVNTLPGQSSRRTPSHGRSRIIGSRPAHRPPCIRGCPAILRADCSQPHLPSIRAIQSQCLSPRDRQHTTRLPAAPKDTALTSVRLPGHRRRRIHTAESDRFIRPSIAAALVVRRVEASPSADAAASVVSPPASGTPMSAAV